MSGTYINMETAALFEDDVSYEWKRILMSWTSIPIVRESGDPFFIEVSNLYYQGVFV